MLLHVLMWHVIVFYIKEEQKLTMLFLVRCHQTTSFSKKYLICSQSIYSKKCYRMIQLLIPYFLHFHSNNHIMCHNCLAIRSFYYVKYNFMFQAYIFSMHDLFQLAAKDFAKRLISHTYRIEINKNICLDIIVISIACYKIYHQRPTIVIFSSMTNS